MPKIKIETCQHTSNYDALEAIMLTMKMNYTNRKVHGYSLENTVKVTNGKTYKVNESTSGIDSESPCSCQYSVKNI